MMREGEEDDEVEVREEAKVEVRIDSSSSQ